MTAYLASWGWGVALLVALAGWGGVVQRVCLPGFPAGWALRAAWGLAASVVVGGLLNLLGVVSRVAVLIYLLVGATEWLLRLVKSRQSTADSAQAVRTPMRRDRVAAVGLSLALVLVLVQYSSWVVSVHFNPHDDGYAYLAFPRKMLQTGALGPDPFSERRLVSSLGGQAFLQVLALATRGLTSINLVDPGLAIVVVAGLLYALLRERGVTPRARAVVLLVWLVVPVQLFKANVTSLMAPVALYLALFATLDADVFTRMPWPGRATVLALLTAALLALKSSLVPTTVGVFVTTSLFYVATAPQRRTAIREVILGAGLTVLGVVPWMISLYRSSGTLLFPFLGQGYLHERYGLAPELKVDSLTPDRVLDLLTNDQAITIHVVALALLGIALVLTHSRRISGREPALSMLLAAIGGVVALALGLRGFDLPRFTFSFVYPTLMALTAVILARAWKWEDPRAAAAWCVTVFTGGLLLGSYWVPSAGPTKRNTYRLAGQRIAAGISNEGLVPSDVAERHRQLQHAIPPGEPILARLSEPFILNMRRNPILLIDWPGGASPPPGMPVFGGPEALAQYLLAQRIRYVAYSYASAANFPLDLRDRNHDPIPANRDTMTLVVQENLVALGTTRRRVYDDGDMFVLDLATLWGTAAHK